MGYFSFEYTFVIICKDKKWSWRRASRNIYFLLTKLLFMYEFPKEIDIIIKTTIIIIMNSHSIALKMK